jgi:hypothetical protein
MGVVLIFAAVALGGYAMYIHLHQTQSAAATDTGVSPLAASDVIDSSGGSSEPDYSPQSDTGIDGFMQAIAVAEGSLAAHPDWNNPGDLTRNLGFPDNGPQNSEGVLAFPDLNTGWGALRAELELIASGQSQVYSPSDTILQMGYKWAGAADGSTWANNVARELGVPVDTQIGGLLT